MKPKDSHRNKWKKKKLRDEKELDPNQDSEKKLS